MTHPDPEPSSELFYEIIIDGELIRIPKKRMEQLADQLLEGDGSLSDKLRQSFHKHPNVDTDVTEEAPPIGNEPDEPTD